MPHALKLLVVAPAALLMACQVSIDAPESQVREGPQAAEEGFSYTMSPASIPNLAPGVSGQLTFGKDAGVPAMVCVLGTENCAVTDDSGGFNLQGLATGASEALFVIAEDHVPLVLPVELAAGSEATLVVDMIPDGSIAPIVVGDTRFSAVREGSGEEVVGDWRMVTPDRATVFSTRASSPSLSYMPLGTWTASFAPTIRATCATTLGWTS